MRTTNMIYVFDIDGTICEKDEFSDTNYENSKPIVERVKIVNKLYDEGNTIIFQTARGMGRFENDAEKAIEMFYDFTANQRTAYTSSSLVELLGSRIPSHIDSQKRFELLVVVLTKESLSNEQWDIVDAHAEWFSREAWVSSLLT